MTRRDAPPPPPRNGALRRPATAALATLAAAALAAALAGCGTVPARPANDPSTGTGVQSGESGVTVFGTIDVGVGGVRSSR